MSDILDFFRYEDDYSAVGDVSVIIISFVFYLLTQAAYVKKDRTYTIFLRMLGVLPMAALLSIIYHVALTYVDVFPRWLIYALLSIYRLVLISILYLFMLYLKETVNAYGRLGEIFLNLGRLGFVAAFVAEAYSYSKRLLGSGSPSDSVHQSYLGFLIFYGYFVALLGVAIFEVKDRVYRQVTLGIVMSMCVSVSVMLVQFFYHHSSYTTISFILPLFALLYLVHSNPYDLQSGSVGMNSFEDLINYYRRKKSEFCLMSLYLPTLDVVGAKTPATIRESARRFASHYFKGATLFQVSNGRLLLAFEKRKNKNYKEDILHVIDNFKSEYPKYGFNYKLLYLDSTDELTQKQEYVTLLTYVENRMNENEARFISESDIKSFHEHEYILSQLREIAEKRDPMDPRILAYAQPVLNTATGKYDTAEVLMRMTLPETGMVFPDRFIPMAEKYNLIQPMTMIILSKTCAAIRKFLDEGYKITRMSVNFSVLDIHEATFCENVREIIHHEGIPFELIAIEVTESRSEEDFIMMKTKIEELQHTGIKFYLDDFGTGYSNFERIMELPFDIIKFDRSLTIASGNDSRTEKMVSYLAHLFIDMGYAVLYEGIEDDKDEDRCVRMCAGYLQGFKYSRPIPIEQLADFFEKEEN